MEKTKNVAAENAAGRLLGKLGHLMTGHGKLTVGGQEVSVMGIVVERTSITIPCDSRLGQESQPSGEIKVVMTLRTDIEPPKAPAYNVIIRSGRSNPK